ncbi:aryl-alcohol dehydrogenase-like predicted oxidoreductase [Actinomadura rupiterrae]|nr:aryl-alcohol dehydrogenase-like predicted oxidoreductase [Actinomadura rupiterrae]
MIPLCRDQGVGVLPYSPLARGLLARESGTARLDGDPLLDRFYDESDMDVVRVVREVAAERDVSPAQVALAWLLGKEGVTAPIVGATKIRHLDDAVAATELELTEAEVARLEEPYRPHPVIGHS